MGKKKHIIINGQNKNIFAPNEDDNYILYTANFMDRLGAAVAEAIGPNPGLSKTRRANNYLWAIYNTLLERASKLENEKFKARQNDTNKDDREAY